MISVIMPSLNVVDYIVECIESVLNQTLQDLDIICIDAGSTDGTWELLNEYAAKDDRIRVIHSDIRSYGYQINLGISLSEGDYVAIVETDDYVHPEMYEYLYQISQETHADMIKADFDSFVSFKNGKSVFTRQRLFKQKEEYYNKVVEPGKIESLYTGIIYIWKGIYRKDFLLENEIRLHESKGAAFQDIGFMHQVLSHATSAYYTDKSFYRYRMDREGSSIHSAKSLGFARQDFQWLIEEKNILNVTPCKRGFFTHMLGSMTGEMRKILPVVDYDIESEFIRPHYEWFITILKKEAMDYFDYFKGNSADFELIIEDLENFATKVKEEKETEKARNEKIKNHMHDGNIVIFGTGIWGAKVLEILYENNLSNIRFSDNNCKLWGTKVNEIEVIPPIDIVDKQDVFLVIIANKYHAKEIQMQLLELGVKEEHIIVY